MTSVAVVAILKSEVFDADRAERATQAAAGADIAGAAPDTEAPRHGHVYVGELKNVGYGPMGGTITSATNTEDSSPATSEKSSIPEIRSAFTENKLTNQFSRQCAIDLARARIEGLAHAMEDQFEFLPGTPKEVTEGWIFFFNTSDFVRTGNPSAALAGNGPLLVTREGIIHELPSAVPWEEAVKTLTNIDAGRVVKDNLSYTYPTQDPGSVRPHK